MHDPRNALVMRGLRGWFFCGGGGVGNQHRIFDNLEYFDSKMTRMYATEHPVPSTVPQIRTGINNRVTPIAFAMAPTHLTMLQDSACSSCP
jgi:hypothetical protein